MNSHTSTARCVAYRHDCTNSQVEHVQERQEAASVEKSRTQHRTRTYRFIVTKARIRAKPNRPDQESRVTGERRLAAVLNSNEHERRTATRSTVPIPVKDVPRRETLSRYRWTCTALDIQIQKAVLIASVTIELHIEFQSGAAWRLTTCWVYSRAR